MDLHPLAEVMCPKCGSENIKDSGERKVLQTGEEVWILACGDCDFKDHVGFFKRTYRIKKGTDRVSALRSAEEY